MKKPIHALATALVISTLAGAAQAQTATGGVGIGTTTPDAAALLDLTSTTQGLLPPRLTQTQRDAMPAKTTGLVVYQTDNTPGLYAYTGTTWVLLSADNLGNHTATQNLNLAANQLVGNGGSQGLSVSSNGFVGIGTSSPAATLHVAGNILLDNGVIQRGGTAIANVADLGLYSRQQYRYMRFVTNQAPIRFYSDDNGGTTANVTIEPTGNVGIGTTNPAFPLDVSGTTVPANFTYGYLNANASVGISTSTGPVSIRAAGRVVASEFNATSDARLKRVLGRSSAAADLGLLQSLRITDYTMRDRVQYGERRFKKVIAQEVEQVFPQAVSQHVGFLPDIYQLARTAVAEGDSLLRLSLPASAGTAAHDGQRLKLVGPTGEVVATVRAASGATLLVRGAQALAGQRVFVFGLEHADVRTVDYEALAMLNVSATQELAHQLEALQQQYATLQAQSQTQATALAQRLQALENLLGTHASLR